MTEIVTQQRKLGIGILGTGSRGVYFAGQYFSKHPDCELSGLCDVRPESLEFARNELGELPAGCRF
jgi:predicted dehydrogenase